MRSKLLHQRLKAPRSRSQVLWWYLKVIDRTGKSSICYYQLAEFFKLRFLNSRSDFQIRKRTVGNIIIFFAAKKKTFRAKELKKLKDATLT